ncbi:hypothetical protein SETIT_2G181600v2 [Setaria italica]|uniref:RING-type E3 ubiquitin transferase n=1 Tax=Setaria italica TaxID=4555 RepID=K3ZWD9_SETIT|nr:E3 ubiquitin-protein ligase RDUF1 [Setaria italica]RCV11383.1 hypothetical protein SETIT_2G181600v2 [Setaria italica]
MTDSRRPDGSYGPEYGPLPPEHEYAMYRHLSSRRRAPWPLQHGDGDYPGRILEQRLRREPFGLSRHPLQPYAPFRIRHANGGGGPRHRREDPGLTDEEFREAMDQLRKQEYRPSNPQKKRHHWTGSARAGAPPAVTEEEKACTICLETFLVEEQVVVTPCNHMFHQGCIAPWVKSHGTCPVCRSALCERRNAVTGNINSSRRNAVTGNINSSSSNGEDGEVDLDLVAMMRAMEEAFSRFRLSDFMSYHH